MSIFFIEEKLLPLGLECLRAFHFLGFEVRVACGFHPCGEEHAAFLGLFVVLEDFVALPGEAFLALVQEVAVVADFVFTIGEKSAVLVTLISPTHLAATVLEHAEATARDHDVELVTFDVTTDIRCHHDEGLAGECLVVSLAFVFAATGKGEGEALAALTAGVRVRGRKGVGDLVARDDRNLARAGGVLAAGANILATLNKVLALGVAGLGRVAAGVLVPGATGHAAVPVTGCKALLAAFARVFVLGGFGVIAAALRAGRLFFAAGARLRAARRGLRAAGARLCRRRRDGCGVCAGAGRGTCRCYVGR